MCLPCSAGTMDLALECKTQSGSNHKAHLLNLFRKVLFAETEDDLDKSIEKMKKGPIFLANPQYQPHLEQDTFPKFEAWSLAKRSSLPTSSNNTNNYVEASFRYTKDIQFLRQKAFNLPDLLSILLSKSPASMSFQSTILK